MLPLHLPNIFSFLLTLMVMPNCGDGGALRWICHNHTTNIVLLQLTDFLEMTVWTSKII